MKAVTALRVRAAHAALNELAAALMDLAPTPEARVAVARAADAWSVAIEQGVTAAGEHPLSPRCDVAGCRGCPVCAPERREVRP